MLTKSYLRVYISAHEDVDIDITILENGATKASSTQWNEEEALSYVLLPNAKYIIRWQFYFWLWNGGFDANCYVSTSVITHMHLRIS